MQQKTKSLIVLTKSLIIIISPQLNRFLKFPLLANNIVSKGKIVKFYADKSFMSLAQIFYLHSEIFI